jgi:hypothetical protein
MLYIRMLGNIRKTKMRFIISILTLIGLNSCQSDIKARFEIVNETEQVIDSINIKSFDHQSHPNYLTLKPGETQTFWLIMTELPKVDGDYLLTYKDKQTELKSKRFGYFTNGYPMEDLTKIRIEKDTVIINQIFNKY